MTLFSFEVGPKLLVAAKWPSEYDEEDCYYTGNALGDYRVRHDYMLRRQDTDVPALVLSVFSYLPALCSEYRELICHTVSLFISFSRYFQSSEFFSCRMRNGDDFYNCFFVSGLFPACALSSPPVYIHTECTCATKRCIIYAYGRAHRGYSHLWEMFHSLLLSRSRVQVGSGNQTQPTDCLAWLFMCFPY